MAPESREVASSGGESGDGAAVFRLDLQISGPFSSCQVLRYSNRGTISKTAAGT